MGKDIIMFRHTTHNSFLLAPPLSQFHQSILQLLIHHSFIIDYPSLLSMHNIFQYSNKLIPMYQNKLLLVYKSSFYLDHTGF